MCLISTPPKTASASMWRIGASLGRMCTPLCDAVAGESCRRGEAGPRTARPARRDPRCRGVRWTQAGPHSAALPKRLGRGRLGVVGPVLQPTEERDRSGNLFLVALDGRRRWYRLQQLFRRAADGELMRRELDSVPLLHARACASHRGRGTVAEALKHATSQKIGQRPPRSWARTSGSES